MARIQKQAAEYLMRQVGQACLEESRRVARCLQRVARGARGLEVAPPELDSCRDDGDTGRPHAVDMAEIGRAGRYDSGQATRPSQQLLRQCYCVTAGRARAEQYCE